MGRKAEEAEVRILDNEGNQPLINVSLFLTPEEAKQLQGYLEDTLSGRIHHGHLNDDEYTHEVTVAVYTPESLSFFDPPSRQLISAPPRRPDSEVYKQLRVADAEIALLESQRNEEMRRRSQVEVLLEEAQKRIRSLEKRLEKLEPGS